MPAPKYPTADEVSRCYPVPPVQRSRGPSVNTGNYCYGNFDSGLFLYQTMTGFNQIGRCVIVRVHGVCWAEERGIMTGFLDEKMSRKERLPLSQKSERISNLGGRYFTGFCSALLSTCTNPQRLGSTAVTKCPLSCYVTATPQCSQPGAHATFIDKACARGKGA